MVIMIMKRSPNQKSPVDFGEIAAVRLIGVG